MTHQFVVSSYSSKGHLNGSVIWNSSKPFGLGYPFQLVLEKSAKGVRVWDLNGKQAEEFTEKELIGRSFSLGLNYKITIAAVKRSEFSQNWNSKQIDPEKVTTATDTKLFHKALFGSFGGIACLLTAAIAVSFLVKPKEEVLVPPQFAKVILTPPKGSNQAGAKTKTNQENEQGHKALSLVQAFKSTEVQKSTQKLLKGGVLALLAKSDFLSDRKSKAMVSAVFNSADSVHSKNTLASISPLVGSAPMNVNVLGSSGVGGSANSVGYGKGDQVGVKGQGNAFVSLNTPDAVVDEGLSKDEVGKVIHSHLAEVRYCYESAMIRNPAIQGKLIADFVIRGSGKDSAQTAGTVKNAKVNMSSVGDASLDQCIIERLNKWKFPKPRGGVDVAVVYPFIFKSLGK